MFLYLVTAAACTMLLLILLPLESAANTTTTSNPLPDFITYFVTVRSFMASQCRKELEGTRLFNDYCPDDDAIRDLVKQDILSGHPDFERAVRPLYNAAKGPPWPYNTTFGALPLTHLYSSFEDRNLILPAVTSVLEEESTGVFKMQYCDSTTNKDPTRCDSDLIEDDQPRAVMNKESFSTWYTDSPRYNRRLGYEQDLTLSSDKKTYTFNAKYTKDGLFNPIIIEGLRDKAFPMSVREENGFKRNDSIDCATFDEEQCYQGKYWFTTEIHTFFQYRGGENFTFEGDDDVHVFINQRLAINLGGEHNAIKRRIALDDYQHDLALQVGKIYSFDMFHVERQTRGSNYAMDTTLSQECNVVNVGLDRVSELIKWPRKDDDKGKMVPFPTQDWFFLSGPGFGYFGNAEEDEFQTVAFLMRPNVPDVVSYMFNRQSQNLGSGFTLEFSFRLSGGSVGHGFALLIQNRGLENLNSGATGPNLGVKNLERSVAIVFDACTDFPKCDGSKFQLRMHYDSLGRTNNVQNSTRRVYDGDVKQQWNSDNEWHTVKLYYYGVPDWFEVYVDNSLRLVERGFDLQGVLGSRDAFVGFSSSSSQHGQAMQVEISNVVVRTVSVDVSRTKRNANTSSSSAFVADGRTQAKFKIHTLDACDTIYTSGGLSNYTRGRLVASKENSATRRLRILDEQVDAIPATVVDNLDGSYDLMFATSTPGEYDLYLAFGEVCGEWNGTSYAGVDDADCWSEYVPNAARATEFITSAPTPMPSAEKELIDWEVMKWVLVGLGCGICCCCFWAVFLVRMYRDKWRKGKKFVEPGKEVVAERGVDYGANPLARRLTQTAHLVQKSKLELEKIRARDPVQDDPHTLQTKNAMYKMNKDLRDEVARMKRKRQEREDMEVTAKSTMVEQDSAQRRISFQPQRAKLDMTNYMSSLEEELLKPELPRPPPTTFPSRFSSSPARNNTLAVSSASTFLDDDELQVAEETYVPPPPPHINDDDEEEELYVVPPPPPPPPREDHEPSPRRLSVSGNDMVAFMSPIDGEDEEYEPPGAKRRKFKF